MYHLAHDRDEVIRMKKIKRFLNKADLVTIALVALLGVSTVFALSQITGTNQAPNDEPVVLPLPQIPDRDLPVFNQVEPTEPVVATPEVFIVPVDTTQYKVTTTFFDTTVDEVAVSSLFYFRVNDAKFSQQSKGMSFTCTTDDAVNVVAPLSGVVTSIVDDHPVYGTMITIDHSDDVQTVLTGVYDVTVTTGAKVLQGDPLGVTGLSRLEPDAGNVVHFEVLQYGEPINPEHVFGRALHEL